MRFSYASGINRLPYWAEALLDDICVKSCVRGAVLSSTTRSPETQARVMWENLMLTGGVDRQLQLYKQPGREVIAVFIQQVKAGANRGATITAMAAKIREIGPASVSAHCNDDPMRAVCDVAPLSIDPDRQREFKSVASKHVGVVKVLAPPLDPAIHIEMRYV